MILIVFVVTDGLVLFSKNFQLVIKGGTMDKILEQITLGNASGNVRHSVDDRES